MSSTNNDSEDDDPRVHSSGMSSSGQPSRRYELSKSELRKNNKPIMEKKRRARINQCLNELKTLILDALKKDPARHTKLEKADILEMTVRHLQSLHRSGGNNRSMGPAGVGVGPSVEPSSSSAALTAAVVQKFQTGYQECAGEVNRFVGRLDGVDVDIKKRLMSHLDACVAKMRYVAAAAGNAPPSHVNEYTLHQQLDSAAVVTGSSALAPSTALAPGGPSPLLHAGVLPSTPLTSSVGHRLRTSAFTAVCGSSPSDVEQPTYVYCDEPADVSSTSSWAEDTAAVAIAVSKNPPLDFSLKKTATGCAGHNKRPLGDISVNVPTLTAAAAAASSSSHKTANAMTASSDDNGPTGPGQRPGAVAAVRPCDDPEPDPNMWRPW